MSVRPIDKHQQPWKTGLLIGKKKPLEPKHVWSRAFSDLSESEGIPLRGKS